MKKQPRLKRTVRALVLVADGFDEPQAVECVSRLREAGAACRLVGLTAGPAIGQHGVSLQPDASLEEALAGETPDLIVLPGGAAGLNAISLDPRVEQLIRAMRPDHGVLALTAAASGLADRRPWEAAGATVLVQSEGQDPAAFIRRAVTLAAQPAAPARPPP